MRGRSEREGEEEESKVAHDEEFIRGVVKESHGFEGRADRGRRDQTARSAGATSEKGDSLCGWNRLANEWVCALGGW